MILHPAEIANELKNYYFFNIFKERFLLQICTMVEVQSYAPGDCIIVEGQLNRKLYFIRSGTVEIYMGGAKIAELSEQGEVMGEMSVVTEKPATSTIVAQTQLEVFVIDTNNFLHFKSNEKDHFELMLYKMFCHILVERLNKENNRTRKYFSL
jgi:signal-transduction protein with cAMP-binding, CBS, and nucleotidyltransferase domain